MFQTALPARIKSRSMGVKLLIVCVLALSMTIPALFVDDLVNDRTHSEADVIKEISEHVGGQQSFLGPTLAIPFEIPARNSLEITRHGTYLVFPAQATAALKIATEERRRSLFRVPVFQADLKLDAAFNLEGVPSSAPEGAVLDWSHAEFFVGVTDARGAMADGVLTFSGKSVTLTPSQTAENLTIGPDQNQQLRLRLFGASAAQLTPGSRFDVSATDAVLRGAADCLAGVWQNNAPQHAGRLAKSQL